MTSRAEYRLLLRQDNADRRLTPIGYEFGSVTEERYQRYLEKSSKVDAEISRLRSMKTDIDTFRNFLLKHECDECAEGTDPELIERKRRDISSTGNQTFAEILRRPAISYDDLAEIDDESRPELGSNEKTEVEVMLKYDGYIRKQISEVEKMRNLESKKLSDSLDYNSIRGLRLEARQKLTSVRPLTLGQASRISGVSPADINVLLIYLEKELRSSSHNGDTAN
jgi:tRNA uridine 5-carboxymethylaminomethyl modification enzyme